MISSQFSQWLQDVQQVSASLKHRYLVVLCGDDQWAMNLLKTIFRDQPMSADSASDACNLSCYLYSGEMENHRFAELDGYQHLSPQNYRYKLGSEVSGLVFADPTFNVDAFAALSGTVTAGGGCFVVLPKNVRQSYLYQQSLFLQRFFNKVSCAPQCYWLDQERFDQQDASNVIEPNIEQISSEKISTEKASTEKTSSEQIKPEQLSPKQLSSVQLSPQQLGELQDKLLACKNTTKTLVATEQKQNFDYGCKTAEQVGAVNAVIQVVKGHRSRPLVLTADRGRGKSSALAIACAQLLTAQELVPKQSQPQYRIIITAPNIANVQVFFQQLKESLQLAGCDDYSHHKSYLSTQHGVVEYKPIDQLINFHLANNRSEDVEQPPSLLLVDEAAGFPVPLLLTLTQIYHRLVFSSTVHGYEGAGRGFSVKFKAKLKAKRSKTMFLHLEQAIRWADDDPLEQFIFDSCLLNARLFAVNPDEQRQIMTLPPSDYGQAFSFSCIDKQSLMKNEALLAEVFAVLVTAHYQTSPNDLKMILDNSLVELMSLSFNNSIIAVALLIYEGKRNASQLSAEAVDQVASGKKRLKNQFIPQALLNYCGVKNSFEYSYARIMRIAVHPDFQSRAIGQYFVGQLQAFAEQQQLDVLGTSFGVNASLLNFWQQTGMNIVRIGFSQDKASGEHSALMLKPLSNRASNLINQLVEAFYLALPYLLVDEFRRLRPNLVWQILHQLPRSQWPTLTSYDQQCIDDFIDGQRLYSDCLVAIHKLLLLRMPMQQQCSEDIELLIAKVLQKQSNAQLCKLYGLTGKKMLTERLKHYVANL